MPYGSDSFCDCYTAMGYTGDDCSVCAPGFRLWAIDGTCQPTYVTAFYYPAPAKSKTVIGLPVDQGVGAIVGIVIAGLLVMVCAVMRVRYSVQQERWRLQMQMQQKEAQASSIHEGSVSPSRRKGRFAIAPSADADQDGTFPQDFRTNAEPW